MKRPRNTTEVLDWEELELAPNTLGAFSFLRPQSAVINIQDHRSLERAHVTYAHPPVKTSTVDITAPVDVQASQSDSSARKRQYRIHKCQSVQDAHSTGENQLHAALWRAGIADPPTARDPETKRVTMGWKRMASLARMSDKAAKRNLTYLIDKLAVDLIRPENSATRTGRTYLVYSFLAILKRRTDAGMLYVVRDKGVRFLTGAEAELLGVEFTQTSTEHKTSTVDKTCTVDKPTTDTVDKQSTGTVDITSLDTVDKTTTPLRSLLRTKERETTTTDVELASIVQALSHYGVADEAAARQIVRDSRKNCKDAQAAEIVAVIHLKAPAIIGSRFITNPLGMLIRGVPKCFEGSGIEVLREHRAAEKQRDEQRKLESDRQHQEFRRWVQNDRLKYEAILADPGSIDAEQKRAVRELARLESFREG